MTIVASPICEEGVYKTQLDMRNNLLYSLVENLQYVGKTNLAESK